MKTLYKIRNERRRDNLTYCLAKKNMEEIKNQYSWLMLCAKAAYFYSKEEDYQIAINLAEKAMLNYFDAKKAIMRGMY